MKKINLFFLLVFVLMIFGVFFGSPVKAYAAISYRSSNTASVTGGGSITINVPSGTTVGDVLVASIFANGNQAAVLNINTPTGWNLLQKVDNQSGSYYPTVTLYYHVVTGSEPASYTWVFSNYLSGAYGGGWIAAFSGVDTTNPIDTSGSQNVGNSAAQTTSYSTPSITTTSANDMLVFAYAGNCATNGFNTPSSASVIGNSINGGCTTGSGFYQPKASSGSISISTTAVTSSYGGAAILALKPLPTVTVTTTGNGGYNYYYFYASGTVNPGASSTIYYGARYGTSNVGCSSLPNNTNINGPLTANSGNNNVNVYISANASTTYYFCIFAYDSSTSTYYYSPTTSSVTTPAPPPPNIAYPLASTIDDTSADIGVGVISYVSSPTVTARWGTSNVSCSSLPNSSAVTSPGNNPDTYVPYTKRITGLSPSTTYYWCFSATTSQGTTYSAVNSFTTASSAVTGCDLLPSSTLASAANKTTLANYLGTSKMQGTLLYKATTNGWAASTFHTNVDNQGATIVLVKNSANNKVFGGYNPQSWSSIADFSYGPNAFLFNLSDGYQLKQVYTYQAYNISTYGPSFGGGPDLGFPNSTLNTSNAAYTNPHSYENPTSKGFSYLHGGTGSMYFTPSEIEVYRISVCTTSAPTVTSPTSSSITATSATLGGNVTSAGTSSITARGICYAPTATDSDPRIGDPGVTCTPEGGTTTGVFTVAVNNLQANTAYSFNAYATNSVGTSYALGTFNTLNPAPTSVTTAANGVPQSYYVTLNGSANPNGYQTYGHFRVFTTNPGNCNVDSGGWRFPEGVGNFPDLNLGSGTSVVSAPTFSYTIPLNGARFLEPNTTYYYCAYAVNTVNSTNYTTGASNVVSFTTPDGPAGPCDPPTTGNLSIPSGAACTFAGTINGVDAGSGTRNTGQLAITSESRLTINPGQKIAYGSISLSRGARMSIARGGSLNSGGIFVHDNDRDNYPDDATQYIGSTPSAATEFVRRNTISSIFNYAWKIASSGATFDCDKNSVYAYRQLPNLVKDQDNDGYKTATSAGPQCVGDSTTIGSPSRIYYKDSAGAYTWLRSSDVLGGGATDCQDNPNGPPCPPVNSSGTNGTNPTTSAVSTSQINLSWGVNSYGGAVPAVNSYDIYKCGLNNSSCTGSPTITNVSAATFSYSDTGLACSTNPAYYYKIVAKNTNGNTQSNIFSGVTSACVSIPTVTSPTHANVTSTTATLGANVTSDGGGTITSRGTCWGTSPNPTSNCVSTTGTTGVFTQARTGLPSNTLIYYRGYAVNSAGTGYSPDGTFTTSKKANGEVCSSGSECVSNICYVDNDNDRYAPASGTATCRAYSQLAGTDCYDNNAEARPGQTNYYSIHRGDGSYDYNCNGLEERFYQNVSIGAGTCGTSQIYNAGGLPGFCANPTGWYGWCTTYSFGTPGTCGQTFYLMNDTSTYAGSYNSTSNSSCNPLVFYATYTTQTCQ